MLFAIIKVIDTQDDDKTPHIVGTNSHDSLRIDKRTGGIQYYNYQCGEGTGQRGSDFVFCDVEMVSFEDLAQLYIEQTKKSVEEEKQLQDFMNYIMSQRNKIIEDSGIKNSKIRHTGGTLL